MAIPQEAVERNASAHKNSIGLLTRIFRIAQVEQSIESEISGTPSTVHPEKLRNAVFALQKKVIESVDNDA